MFAKYENLKVGDVLQADDGFTCLEEGAKVVVAYSREDDGFYVPCSCGRHYLMGQVDDTRSGEVVGLTKVLTSMERFFK